MSEVSATVAISEARQSMIRVWMAISAIWVAFWLLIIAAFLTTVELRYPVDDGLDWFALILLAPPLSLLAIGVIGRFTFERFGRSQRSRLGQEI